MKKFLTLLLAVAMAVSFAACSSNTENEADDTNAIVTDEVVDTDDVNDVNVMTYDEYMAAEIDDAVVVDCYVQATQSWWDNKITVYAQDEEGGYFIYDMACAEEDAASLTAGQKIRVTGTKAEWSGEIEIMDATFELLDEDVYVAEALDVTEFLGTDELIDFQNQFVAFSSVTVESVEYKNGEPGDDIYLNVKYNDESYSFCVEYYLTDDTTDVYAAVGELTEGDVINVEGFLYWYEGVNTHVTSVSLVEA